MCVCQNEYTLIMCVRMSEQNSETHRGPSLLENEKGVRERRTQATPTEAVPFSVPHICCTHVGGHVAALARTQARLCILVRTVAKMLSLVPVGQHLCFCHQESQSGASQWKWGLEARASGQGIATTRASLEILPCLGGGSLPNGAPVPIVPCEAWEAPLDAVFSSQGPQIRCVWLAFCEWPTCGFDFTRRVCEPLW